MMDLPLNHELTDIGGRFLRAGKTSRDYRLFRLQGPPPARPGLIRVEDGFSIDVEVWALPLHYFGTFILSVPQPLSIGTLKLDDGSCVKGFMCEKWATETAEDVSHFGSWRKYLSMA